MNVHFRFEVRTRDVNFLKHSFYVHIMWPRICHVTWPQIHHVTRTLVIIDGSSEETFQDQNWKFSDQKIWTRSQVQVLLHHVTHSTWLMARHVTPALIYFQKPKDCSASIRAKRRKIDELSSGSMGEFLQNHSNRWNRKGWDWSILPRIFHLTRIFNPASTFN